MVTIEDIRNTLQENKKELKEKYGVSEIGVFGSYLRGVEGEYSDVDILVEFDNGITLLEFIEMENFLSDLMGVKVDLVMKDALKPRIGEQILAEVVYC